MNKIRTFGKILAGLLAFLLFWAFGGLKLIISLLGATTTLDDAEALPPKVAQVLDWLVKTPWWVVSLILLVGCVLATWSIVSGVRDLVGQQKLRVELPEGTITAAQAKLFMSKIDNLMNDYQADREKFLRALETGFTGPLEEGFARIDNSIKSDITSYREQLEQAINEIKLHERALTDIKSGLESLQRSQGRIGENVEAKVYAILKDLRIGPRPPEGTAPKTTM